MDNLIDNDIDIDVYSKKVTAEIMRKYIKEIYTNTTHNSTSSTYMHYYSKFYCLSIYDYSVFRKEVINFFETIIDNAIANLNKPSIFGNHKLFNHLWYNFQKTFMIKTKILCYICNTCVNKCNADNIKITRDDMLKKVSNMYIEYLVSNLPCSIQDVIITLHEKPRIS
jgi:hypothetical protein